MMREKRRPALDEGSGNAKDWWTSRGNGEKVGRPLGTEMMRRLQASAKPHGG